MLGEPGAPVSPEATEFLHLAAVASLTEVAVEEAKDEVEQNLRGSFLEELRAKAGELDAGEVLRRAARLGCDLSRGAVALCAAAHDRPPAPRRRDDRGRARGRARAAHGAARRRRRASTRCCRPARARRPRRRSRAARRLGDAAAAPRHRRRVELLLRPGRAGPRDPGGRAGARRAAALRRSPCADEDIGTGTYRLLFRVLASHPEEVRSFFDDTVAPIVAYDDQYATDLVGTLEAYLEQNCNMNATAAAIYAHRHTVAYRLERVKELTGLDPMQSEDRERLGLGLKAYRIIAPRLPR